MAVTQNTYTGNGSTVLYSFTFPYLETTDIKVSVNGTVTTAYTLANATTIQFNSAPANGAAIRIYRETDDSALAATFYPGSAIRSQDLNENFTQNLYVTQESTNNAATATTTANTALTNSNTAISTANSAVSTANTASSNASAAVATANTASSNASAAVTTANTASSNATTAVNTANAASATANTAFNQSNDALSDSADALAIANSALDIVAGTIQYVPVANVAAIPGSPSDGDAVQVVDSTGIQSFSPLTGLPGGFVGTPALNVKIQYSNVGSTWQYRGYEANDPDARYVVQGKLGSAASPAYYFDANTGIYSPGADQLALSTNGTGRLFVNADGTIDFGTTTGSSTPTVKAVANPVLSFSNGTNSAYVGLVGVQNRLINFSTNGTTLIQSDSAIDLNVVGGSTFTVGTNNQERLRITSDGKLGLGTSSPAAKLEVNGAVRLSGGEDFQLEWINNGQNWRLNNSTGGRLYVYDVTNAKFPFGIDANTPSDTLTLKSSGCVGIGTSAPGTSLDVRGIISLGSSSVANAVIQKSAVPGGSFNLTITSGGGLASESATTPTDALAGSVIKLLGGDPTTDTFGGGIQYYANGSTSPNGAGVGNQHVFYTRSAANTYTERLRIDAAGRVGIGSGDTSLGQLQLSGANGVTLAVKNTTGTTTGTEFCQITLNNTSNSSANFESAKIKAISTNGAVNLSHLTFEVGASERFRCDSSGRLLVGTSSTSQSDTNAVLEKSGGAKIYLARNEATPVDTAALGGLYFSDNTHTGSAFILAQRDGGTWSGSSKPTRLLFSTTADGASSPTERMRITNSGFQRIYSSAAVTHVSQSSSGAGTTNSLYYGAYGATDNQGTSAVNSYVVWSNGNVQNTNNSYTAISDIKLKENIADAGSQWADLKALRVRNYNLKEGQTHRQIGLIAQEVEPISPGLVYESPDRDAEGNDLGTVTKSVNYSVLYMKAVKALQEAMERIETLEAKVAALESV